MSFPSEGSVCPLPEVREYTVPIRVGFQQFRFTFSAAVLGRASTVAKSQSLPLPSGARGAQSATCNEYVNPSRLS